MCERCWGKAFTAAYGIGSKTQAGEYERIVASCACTPAQRRGVADSFAEGYTARDKEIEELRNLSWQKLADNDAEIATLRARVAELEGMVPKWVWKRDQQLVQLEHDGWVWDRRHSGFLLLYQIPPIPAPETK